MTIITLKPCTEERYFYHLDILPPAYMNGAGFLVGEAIRHRLDAITGKYDQPTFAAFFQFGTSFWESEVDLTLAEYKAITPSDFRQLILKAQRKSELEEPRI